MKNKKQFKAEQRELQRKKLKAKKQRGATFAGQHKKMKLNRNYSGKQV